MATEKLSVRRTRQVLRQRMELDASDLFHSSSTRRWLLISLSSPFFIMRHAMDA